MKKEKSEKYRVEDDGHVIANMNVEGMPWYQPDKSEQKDSDFSDLTRTEKRAMLRGIFAAAFLIGGIFLLAFFLFIVFCIKVWFK